MQTSRAGISIMPDFAYHAVTPTGRTMRGIEEAASERTLEGTLKRRGLLLLDVTAASGKSTSRRGFATKRADAVEAIRYLATLIDVGFPLDRALGTVERVVARADVATALRDARDRVRGGASLADAFHDRPDVFPRIAVGMVQAGEQGGHLATALARLAEHLEREERLRAQVLSALLYPATLATVGGAAVLVLVLYVLPQFVGIIDEVGAALPRSTALLMATSTFLGKWWPVIAVATLIIGLIFVAYRRSPAGRLVIDGLLLQLPVIGPLRQNLTAARFGRSLGTLLDGGLPILTSLDVAAHTLTDAAAAEQVTRAREEVQAGVTLAQALGRGSAFPFLFHQMVELGEEAGRLPEMLERAAGAAEQTLERGLDRMVRLVEPAMIVFFGGIAGLVAVSLLQAIYGIQVTGF